MDLDMLASDVVPYVTAAVGAYGTALLTRVEEGAASDTVRVGRRLVSRLLGSPGSRPGIEQAIVMLASAGDDPDFQAALRAQIKLVLRQDARLADDLAAVLASASASASASAPSVSALGERSVAVGRDNTGQISTGDSSTHIYGTEVYYGSRVTKRRILILPFGFFIRTTKTVAATAGTHPIAATAAGAALLGACVAGGLALAQNSVGDPLTGTWQDTSGNIVQFVPTGADTWTGQVVQGGTDICLPVNIHLTGSNGHYQGTEAYYTGTYGNCGTFLANGTITITLQPGNTTAAITQTPPNHSPTPAATWTRH